MCEEKLQFVQYSLVQSVMEYAVDESLKSAEAPFISGDVLPVIGAKYCAEVMRIYIFLIPFTKSLP